MGLSLVQPVLTVENRKKKCSQTYPVCGHCSRLNLVCKWEGPRLLKNSVNSEDVAESAPVHDRTAPLAGSKPDRDWQQQEQSRKGVLREGTELFDLSRLAKSFLPPQSELNGPPSASGLSSSRRAMLRYYTASFAFMLTTNVENNCFLSGASLDLICSVGTCPPSYRAEP